MKRDYSKGFIYKLCCLDPNITEIYVGSSTNYQNRKQHHKNNCNNEKWKQYNYKVYQFIRAHGGWENWRMVILHEFPCNSRRELEQEETRMMIELKSELNQIYSFQTEEIKREAMDRNNKKAKERYHKNSEKINEKRRDKRKNDEEYREKLNKKAKEKIECEFCNSLVRKYGLKQHQESANCIKHQQQQGISVDENIGKVQCEFCNCLITRKCLKQHQESEKCIEHQQGKSVDEKQGKVQCEFCKCLIRKDGLKRHQQQNKNCIKHQQQQGISVDENIGKVECEFCQSLIRRSDLKRHQTTAKYCIKIQNK